MHNERAANSAGVRQLLGPRPSPESVIRTMAGEYSFTLNNDWTAAEGGVNGVIIDETDDGYEAAMNHEP